MSQKNPFQFQKISDGIKNIPILLANETRKYFIEAFKNQEWDGKPWEDVKRRQPGTPEYKYPKNKGLGRRTSAILVRTGTLRRAVNNSITETSMKGFKIKVSVPGEYASYLNDGTNKMPSRKFVGHTQELEDRQRKIFDREFEKVWQE